MRVSLICFSGPAVPGPAGRLGVGAVAWKASQGCFNVVEPTLNRRLHRADVSFTSSPVWTLSRQYEVVVRPLQIDNISLLALNGSAFNVGCGARGLDARQHRSQAQRSGDADLLDRTTGCHLVFPASEGRARVRAANDGHERHRVILFCAGGQACLLRHGPLFGPRSC